MGFPEDDEKCMEMEEDPVVKKGGHETIAMECDFTDDPTNRHNCDDEDYYLNLENDESDTFSLDALDNETDNDSEDETDCMQFEDCGNNDQTENRDITHVKPWEKTLPEFVVGHMAHNPCGPRIPGGTKRSCWKYGKCKAKMPRVLIQDTDAEVDGYALYRRRQLLTLDNPTTKMPTLKKFVRASAKNNDISYEDRNNQKNNKKKNRGQTFEFDNQWIPGFNPAVLMKYRCHISNFNSIEIYVF